ncbi:MAG: DUF3576 domain-containing protein [Neomegalonema sp.]|nr:DUF3576 domain-containing protein [Neomegalonema sp.]
MKTSVLMTAAVLMMLQACSSAEVKSEYPKDDAFGNRLRAGEKEPPGLFNAGAIFGSGESSGETTNLPVNKYLWRASLDTLAFLPLASTDPYGGVIVTEWGSSPASPNERMKVSTYITSAELKPQSLKAVVNRQVRNEAGQWVEAPVSAETARKLENAILTRARQIKSAEPEK